MKQSLWHTNPDRQVDDHDSIVSLSNPPSAEAKALWEYRKLRADAIKAENDAVLARRARRYYEVAALLPIITTLVAVSGLVLTAYNAQQQSRREAATRREDQFNTVVQQYTQAGTRVARIAPLSALETFAGDTAFRKRAHTFVLSAILGERDPLIRARLRDLMISTSDSSSLALLAEQNRFLRDRASSLGIHPDADARAVTWPREWLARDSTSMQTYEDLGWNIEVLIKSMNRLKVVSGNDFKDIQISRLWVRYDSYGTPDALYSKEYQIRIQGVKFVGVDFTRANLARSVFVNDTFINTSLDSAVLAGTVFYRSSFGGQTRIQGFSTWVTTLQKDSAGSTTQRFNRPALWNDCDLNIPAFSPAWDPDGAQAAPQVYFRFLNTRWSFQSVFGQPGDAPVKLPRASTGREDAEGKA